jgi:1,4-dihydroxy-2-naphthoyl-CoA hydrolase
VPAPDPPGLDALLGLEHLDAADGEARARAPVREHLLQPLGLVHGGVLAAVAESACVAATARGAAATARTLGLHISFLRPVTEGAVHAHGRARHRGRTTWVWETDLTDDAGRLCALVRVTVAVGEPGRPPGT